jgi:hypothetical protein
MANHIYGNHDESQDLARLLQQAGKTGWQVKTFGIGDDPADQSGYDFSAIRAMGITPIARLNYSHHGEGTIPLPDRYAAFALRCANFVRASVGCTHWVIGNEPNLAGERPQGTFIRPEQYARCFTQARQAIRLQSNAPHKVIHAAVAPYNVDSGDWILYWETMLREIWLAGGADGINIHTYSRGPDPNSIFSEAKMDPPYQEYYNGFRAYKDFLAGVPVEMRHLPAYITETDQLEPWKDANDGWVLNAYKEVNNWNLTPGTQKIHCLCLYRWDKHDQWEFQSKQGVVADFRNTLTVTDYRVLPANGGTVHIPQAGTGGGPSVVVITPAGANLRNGPSTTSGVLGAVPTHTVLRAIGKTADEQWWQVESEKWGKVWVSTTVVNEQNVKGLPVVQVVVPPQPGPAPAPVGEVNEEWMISTWSRILDLDETVVRAVLAIESGGRAFENGRMIIRFENHVFHDKIGQLAPGLLSVYAEHFKYGSPPWTGHYVKLPQRTDWEKQHDGGQAEEWVVFNYARSIHETAAMLSISMGMGQIMGGNYVVVGYPSVQAMFQDYNHPTLGKYNQLAGFFSYAVSKKGMLDALRAKDWNMIARLYNGAGNEAHYAPLLRNKYLELGGKD